MRTALIAAAAALLGALVGLVSSIVTTYLTASNERDAGNLRVARESCAEFIASASEVHLRLNSVWLVSLYQPPTPRSDYIQRMDELRTSAIPAMYGKQAVLQLSTRSVQVSQRSNDVVNALVKEINYISDVVGSAPDIAPRGLIRSDKMRGFGDEYDKARNILLDSCRADR